MGLITNIGKAYKKDSFLPQSLKEEIVSYNEDVLSFSSDAIIPAERPVFGRWFDDYTVTSDIIEDCT